MKIEQIDVLVHPDFYQMDTPELPLHERQKELRRKWNERIYQIKRQENVVLLYFSNIPENDLKQGLQDENYPLNRIQRDDIIRIKRYKEILRHRFILFSKLDLPKEKDLKEIFHEREFSYDPNTTRIFPYGEAFEACVTAWGYHIKNELGIPDNHYDFYTEGMSLTFADTHEIKDWREGKETEIPRPSIS